jgi:hypothetical protein
MVEQISSVRPLPFQGSFFKFHFTDESQLAVIDSIHKLSLLFVIVCIIEQGTTEAELDEAKIAAIEECVLTHHARERLDERVLDQAEFKRGLRSQVC